MRASIAFPRTCSLATLLRLLSLIVPTLMVFPSFAAALRPMLAVSPPMCGWVDSMDGWATVPTWVWLAGLLAVAIVDVNLHLRLQRAVCRRLHAERRLEELGDNLPAVVYQARRHSSGRIELAFVAGDAMQLFALSSQVLQQRPEKLLAAVLPADRWRLLARLRRGVHSGRPICVDFRARGVHGLRNIAMRAWPAQDGQGERWNGYWMDDSLAHAQRKAWVGEQRRVQHEARARDHLLQVLGDSIHGPLQGLERAVAQVRSSPLDSDQWHAADALQQATVMLKQVMADVLQEPVDDVDALPLRPQTTDLHGLLRQVRQLMLPLAHAKGLQLRLRSSPNLADALQVDALRLRQVLLNLIGNAIKFTQRGGVHVRVRVIAETEHMQYLQLQVCDSGVGIAAGLQDQVFEPYRQASASIARDFGGTGLGLGICRRLVQRMGGQLRLRSRPGRGTRVTLDLALARAAPSRAAVHGAGAAQVLVAEDHPAHRLLLQWWLQGMGLQVVAVADGVQALRAWRDGRFQLLVCDEQMPGLSGSSLAERIREEEDAAGASPIAIIGMSAEPEAMHTPHIDRVLDKQAGLDCLRGAIQRLRPPLLATADGAAATPGVDWPPLELQGLQQRLAPTGRTQQLLQLVSSSLDDDLQQLRHHIASGDGMAAAACLHRVAGAMGSIGLRDLAQWLREISVLAQPLPEDLLREAVQRLLQLKQRLQALGAG